MQARTWLARALQNNRSSQDESRRYPGVRRPLLAALAVALLATGLLVAPTSSAATTPQPSGLFVQLSSIGAVLTPDALRQRLQAICTTGGPSEIVLQDIGTAAGTLYTSHLDAIAPLLPGGKQACFQKVFVGSLSLPWTGAGSAYHEGILDGTLRSRYRTTTRTLQRAFISRYPKVQLDWYVSYEANLNELYYTDVASAYQSLLVGQLQDQASLRPGRTTMWSPAFWYRYSTYQLNALGMSGLRTNLSSLLSAAPVRVDLQDFVGGSTCWGADALTPSDAIGWQSFLRSVAPTRDIRLNVEQYTVDCVTGALGATADAVLDAREALYVASGARLGAAFELRYWLNRR